MHIWQMESYPVGDKRLPHHVFPPKMFTPDQLQNITGVVSYKVDLEDVNATKKRLSRVKAERNVLTSDLFTLSSCYVDLDQRVNLISSTVKTYKNLMQFFRCDSLIAAKKESHTFFLYPCDVTLHSTHCDISEPILYPNSCDPSEGIYTRLIVTQASLDELYEPIAKDEDSIYLILDGSAYYDIETPNDEWIRVCVEKGDLIVIPKGIYHRFTLTPHNHVLIQRFFPDPSSDDNLDRK